MTEDADADLERRRFVYCTSHCRAACCYLHDPHEGVVRCPNLKSDHTCRIYHQRYAPGAPDLVQVGRFRSTVFVNKATDRPAMRPFVCGRIEQLLAANEVPQHIRDGCCYANPQLLDEIDL